MSLKTLLVAASTLAMVRASPAGKMVIRDWIASDEIVGFNQTVPDDQTGDIYLAYQPYLKVVNGCVPFPGVDAEGNTDAGLAITGSSDGDCTSSTGQIYVRSNISTTSTSTSTYPTALMYSWYMPKDEPSPGIGHRHDWEGVIVWLADGLTVSADNILAVCPSAHGGWDCSTDGYTLDGTKPLIKYESVWPVDHSCGLTTTVGGTQPLVAWESLTTAARDALQTVDFDKAIVPFKDATWEENLGKASF